MQGGRTLNAGRGQLLGELLNLTVLFHEWNRLRGQKNDGRGSAHGRLSPLSSPEQFASQASKTVPHALTGRKQMFDQGMGGPIAASIAALQLVVTLSLALFRTFHARRSANWNVRASQISRLFQRDALHLLADSQASRSQGRRPT